MTDRSELISTLREYAEWAEANIYEVPITLPDVLKDAADELETLTAPKHKTTQFAEARFKATVLDKIDDCINDIVRCGNCERWHPTGTSVSNTVTQSDIDVGWCDNHGSMKNEMEGCTGGTPRSYDAKF